MAGCMNTPLGTEVDLGPGHIVLDGVPAPAKGAQQPLYFRPMSIVAMIAHLSYCRALVYFHVNCTEQIRKKSIYNKIDRRYLRYLGNMP